jgi:hypothetical protein
MSAIRRANPKSRVWKTAIANIESDKIQDIEVTPASTEALFADYPYDGQEILQAEFKYLLDTPDGEEPTALDMSFYYRSESSLWILDPGRRDTLTEEVVRQLKIDLMDNLSILPGVSVSKQGMWNFIGSARDIRDIIVRNDFESVSWDEIEGMSKEDVFGDKIVMRAELVFEFAGETIDVIYYDNNLSVKTDLGDGFEFIMQQFETNAIHS